ncbi:precorrin-8X methylmutase [Candidatus Solincola tengchongensis]|uniref:precorrin-8X methylmutase n=1 Tax=Candidatus Solincola tengchongensis TaxID=2900693 RepID=UPI00257A884F|nr:precorrin-8X methylmutase [Candidatus Solincola tengchongensis]
MEKSGVILLAHGSREDESTTRWMEELLRRAANLLPDGLQLEAAYLQFNRPSLEKAVERMQEDSIEVVYVLPLFLHPGRHLRQDIPSLVERLAERKPGIRLELLPSLGEQPWLFEALARWIAAELPDAFYDGSAERWRSVTGEEIMRASMRLARDILGNRCFREGEEKVLMRILHATGDPTILGSVFFSPGAVDSGVKALRRGAAVIADVGMVKAGLNRGVLERLGCPVYCAAERREEVPASGTRVGNGILDLRGHLDGSVVVVGNAPTALMTVIRLVREEGTAPALVIGTPVGFIQALESKRSLMALGIPYITVQGSRGGSSVAVAAANALLEMAAGDRGSQGPVPAEEGGGK